MSTAISAKTSPAAVPGESIRIRGARVHNLQNVDVEIPRHQLIVVTGPSGSGKSSLAFDTLFAEGQRQFIESLAVNVRQRLAQLPRPDVDSVEGLQPTVCIDQRSSAPGPRATVGTVTEIYDHLRLLLARTGQPHCPQCGEPIHQQSPTQIEDDLAALPEGTKLMLLAPRPSVSEDALSAAIASIRKAGLLRVRLDGELYELDSLPRGLGDGPHRLEAVVDRIIVRASGRSRLLESLRLALREGGGVVTVCRWDETPGGGEWRDTLYSTLHACAKCQIRIEEIEPRTFSFNSPYGACPACGGLGTVSATTATTGTPAATTAPTATTTTEDNLEELDRAAEGDDRTCPDCAGTRLRPVARLVRLGELAIQDMTRLSIAAARQFFEGLSFPVRLAPIGEPVVREIARRLAFLERVGVGYLTLDRRADTLSGGEFQRVRLASSIGSGLCGVCYVLDEPSIGLHPRDNQRLIDALRELQHQGNTVLVVEHDEAMMRQADWLIDVGPGAGSMGGQIVAAGTPREVIANPASVTGNWLAGNQPPLRRPRRTPTEDRFLILEDAGANNLRRVTAEFPLGCFVAVTGVSGSGKSTLVNDTLAPLLKRQVASRQRFGKPLDDSTAPERLRGSEHLDQVVVVDQAPIGRSPRSSPATFTGIFDAIRAVFAATRDAKRRGFRAARFSFNAAGGRCETCLGHGVRKVEMNFLPDLYIPCDTCGGARFNRQTLAVRFRGQSIADVLAMSVDHATHFFENFEEIRRVLQSLRDVGLGYLPLGQPSTTLSGGEAQRIKLATELARVETGRTAYLLDEPTTGLHFSDVQRLLDVLHRLVDRGNTVLVIEHHLDVLRSADWLIDLGPEGGEEGGTIVCVGPPERVALHPTSNTGRFLRESEPRDKSLGLPTE